jgi:glycine oxidase
MKIAIIGNGSIAMFTAISLAYLSDNDVDVTVIGPLSRPYSASSAAGLMLNIFSEVDEISYNMPLTQWKLQNWEQAIKHWDLFFGSDGIVSGTQIFTSTGTKLYRKFSPENKLEHLSFERQLSIAKQYGVLDPSSVSDHSFFLPNEPSADSFMVLSMLDAKASEKISLIDSKVTSLVETDSGCKLVLEESRLLAKKFDQVILCAGSKSSALLNNSSIDRKPSIHCFNGVGSALLMHSEYNYVSSPTTQSIIRSPNRGGTCGIHLVQRECGVYVGASSVVTDKDIKLPRIGSVETLIKGAHEELEIPMFIRQSFEIVTGYRPVTQDAVPLVGRISERITCCYGHKRDGFTWAPYIASLISALIFDQSLTPSQKAYLELTNPLRKISHFLGYDESLELYLMNERYSALQHAEDFDSKREKILTDRFRRLHDTNAFHGRTCHPELVNVNYYYSYPYLDL